MAERKDTLVAGSGMELEIGSGRKSSPVSSKMSGYQRRGRSWLWFALGVASSERYKESLQGQAGRQTCG